MEDQSLRSALGPGPDCLSIERLGRYADGILSDDERCADESHITACANCQAELTLLQAFAASTVRDDEAAVVRAGVAQLRRRESEIFAPVPQSDGASWRRWLSVGTLRPALTLAGLLLLISGGYYLTNPAAPRLPTDVGSGSEAMRSMGILLVEPIGDQTAVPDRLRWQPVSGAAKYHVRLMEVDRHEIWSSDTANASVDLPAGVQARISPAKTLVWQVTAYGASNTLIAESDPQRFRLAR